MSSDDPRLEPWPTEESHHLRDLIDPDTHTVILVPGLDGTAELFYRQTPLLARYFNVIAFPLPDRREASMEDLIADLVVLIDEVSLRPVILIGESFGGALSMSLALRHPHLVEGSGDRQLVSLPGESHRAGVGPVDHQAGAVGRDALRPAVHRAPPAQRSRPRRGPPGVPYEQCWGSADEGYIRRLELVAEYDIRHRLQDIAMPTLFVAGTDDRLVPSARWADYMGERVPDAEVVKLDGYGHCCLINHDLDLASIVSKWWSMQPPGADLSP